MSLSAILHKNSGVIGIGLDLIEVSRIRDLLERHGERFKARTFTVDEIAYCDRCADPAMHYAARFAAKEAAAKALSTGFADGVSWQDIEIARAENGAPRLVLHGGALSLAQARGITQMLVSLTHVKEMAAAQVVLGAGPAAG
ncbi:MAG: holo-ACP synthase [Verrucomicrobiaceae bacterium]|nr:holo-ACP synthase [Verrucomicrobiaceae bacterium]